MARPRTDVGTWGRIAVTPQVQGARGRFVALSDPSQRPARWRARAKVRDIDGKLREVERFGPTKTAAERELKAALASRTAPDAPGATLTSTSLLKTAARLWLEDLEDAERLSLNTRRVYAIAVRKHVIGANDAGSLANLTLRELKVSGIERMLRDVSKAHGPSAAKMTRSVLSGILDLAVRHDALPHNLVRSLPATYSTSDRRPSTKDTSRAFTRAECDVVLTYANTNPKAVERDLGDLLAFLAGTGARLGEALALRWSAVDLAEGTAQLGPTVVRVKGSGLVIQEAGKTKTSSRTVRLPQKLIGRLMARQVAAEGNEWDVVFLSPYARLRDPSNTSHDIRDLLDACGFGWASAHTFRKSVATWLDQAGASGREVANQLGHARPSMTLDVYMDRHTITEAAADL